MRTFSPLLASAVLSGVLGFSTLGLTGCATTPSSRNVSSQNVGQSVRVEQAKVISVREVTITPDNSIVGAVTGAVLGGIAGSEIGGGKKANTAGTVGGAVIGGVAGNQAGKALNTRPGYAYIVQFSDGELREVVQGQDVYIAPGSNVYVTYGDKIRITPTMN